MEITINYTQIQNGQYQAILSIEELRILKRALKTLMVIGEKAQAGNIFTSKMKKMVDEINGALK